MPKASQPRVRGCLKVTVRFKGRPSSWSSGGTGETQEKEREMCTPNEVLTIGNETAKNRNVPLASPLAVTFINSSIQLHCFHQGVQLCNVPVIGITIISLNCL